MVEGQNGEEGARRKDGEEERKSMRGRGRDVGEGGSGRREDVKKREGRRWARQGGGRRQGSGEG